jgi:hypothetical protein
MADAGPVLFGSPSSYTQMEAIPRALPTEIRPTHECNSSECVCVFFPSFLESSRPGSTITDATTDPLHQPRMVDDDECGMFGRENKYSDKTCANATLFTTNPTWADLGSIASGRIRSIEKSNYLIGTRPRELPACRRAP